jgi:SAM-dependent methyltransferase
MNRTHAFACSLLMVTLTLAPARVLAQAQAPAQETKPFEPSVGQAGKDVIWVPTPQELVDKMMELAKVTSSDVVVDLGSGDGRTVITAAKLGANARGIEYDPNMVDLSKRNAAAAGVSQRAQFAKADLFETDFSNATVVTMFLLPSINMRLRPKLLEMRPGTRIVSNSFTMEDWQPDRSETIPNCSQWCTAHLWIVPAKVAGTWRLPQGELQLTQEFQQVTGTLNAGGGAQPIVNGKLQGELITFVAGGTEYSGRVTGDAMQGTAKMDGKAMPWTAARAR